MKTTRKDSMPTDVATLQQHLMDIIATNRHVVRQNGQLIIEVNAVCGVLNHIMSVYRSEDGQELLDVLAHYAAMADAQAAIEKAKGVHRAPQSRVQ